MTMYIDEKEVQEKVHDKNYGVFIVFEGPDGSGKSTLLRMVGEAIRRAIPKVLVTREPYFSSVRSWLREKHTPAAMALVMLGDRIDHLAQVVIPSLNNNEIVLSDRYDASTLVYNVICGDIEPPIADPIFRLQAVLPVPDLYVYAYAPSKVLQERIEGRTVGAEDRDDSDLTEGFIERVSRGYDSFFQVWQQRYGQERVLKVRTDVSMEAMQELAERIAGNILSIWRERKTLFDA